MLPAQHRRSPILASGMDLPQVWSTLRLMFGRNHTTVGAANCLWTRSHLAHIASQQVLLLCCCPQRTFSRLDGQSLRACWREHTRLAVTSGALAPTKQMGSHSCARTILPRSWARTILPRSWARTSLLGEFHRAQMQGISSTLTARCGRGTTSQ